jgi:phosphotransferase system  glucose/maltose/N-acetylglucosamine-specific IIC component
MAYTALKEIIKSFLEELKCVLKEYADKQEAALKARLKKILIISIMGMVILALAISLAGAASLFFLIGTLRYLETFLPAWQAWLIMAATTGVIATVLFTALYLIIRKQLTTPKATTEQQTVNNQ